MINNITKGLTKILLGTSLFLGASLPFVSCEEQNYPPKASIEVSPTYGESPLEVRIQVTGEDLDGIEDIKEYRVNIQNEVIKSKTPIDITRTFEKPGIVKIYGEVVDSEEAKDKTDINSVEVYGAPFIEQSVSLANDVKIKYNSILSRVDKAELKVSKDGEELLTKEVKDVNETGTDYEAVFDYISNGIKKGNYEFTLKSENLEKKNSIEVPNYNPSINLSGIDANLMEETDKTITLPVPADKNPEDNPVNMNSAKSLDNKTQVVLDGYDLKIKALPNKVGNYQVELEFGNTEGGLEKAILSGNITDDPRMKINPFVSTNSNGVEYDLLTTKEKRDSLVQVKLNEDWVSEIAPSDNPYWGCTEYSNQLDINFHGFPDLTGYAGDNLDSIYYYHKTLKDNGKYGLPFYFITIPGTPGHNMNAILTGNDIIKWEDWNFIEPQFDKINIQPGQAYMPKNCEIVVNYTYVNERDHLLDGFPILRFQIINSVPTLIWKNDDPNLNIIEERGK